DRPTMSSVVLMLGNENALPLPKQPAFFAEEEMPEHRSISSGPTSVSVNDITIKLKGLKGQKEAKTVKKPTRNERDKKKSEETAKDQSRISRHSKKGQNNEAKD
ncbi:G-type lectin S-receptor-like serine/threonine-protein kinase isoform X2, partial [Tanacetum coccineum]